MHTFSGLLKPANDESLSSWLTRMHEKGYLDTAFRSEAQRLADKDVLAGGDLDLLYKSNAFLGMFTADQQTHLIKHFHLWESEATPLGLRDKYCRECFMNDIRALQMPIWRKSWRLSGACVCSLHPRPVLLSQLVTRQADLSNQGWQAFKEYLESPSSRLGVDFTLTRVTPQVASANNTKLLLMTQRVQRWYQAALFKGVLDDQAGRALQFLMGLWLHPSAWPNLSPGIARTYFHTRPSNLPLVQAADRITSPELSLGVAAPRDIAVAYWMMGVSYGLVSHAEAELINKIVLYEVSSLPTTKNQVAVATTRNYWSTGLGKLWGEAKASLTESEFNSVSWVFSSGAD
ncbi:TniQ family protein [Pseudomonas monteilii]|uniref:TniQ family protein n=1 Tax=Pseudomonas monteilii TaxID=76759 RepID=UPI001FD61137|nr:TniQ family protein [Pseudomonas monteilii]MCJ7853091.1 TniQ family protein [Pseudomonas monteilii]